MFYYLLWLSALARGFVTDVLLVLVTYICSYIIISTINNSSISIANSR